MVDTSILNGKKAAYYTLGCKLNFSETSTLRQTLENYGVVSAVGDDIADICIINTCSVTDVADHKCRQAINRMIRRHPGALVIVTGCYAQLKPDQIASAEGVDMVVGAEHKGNIVSYIIDAFANRNQAVEDSDWTLSARKALAGACSSCESENAVVVKTKDIKTFSPSCSKGERTRYFLKVQDGCNYYCTYCTIPFARGRSRNGSIESMVDQAEKVAQEGGKEIVITGVNIGDFGKSTNETFYELIKELDKVEGIERYRISSIEPDLLTDEIIEFVASSRAFMPHFHIPLQSGSDDVLKLMRRHYDTALFADKINRIKTLIPDAFIGVDVIVGMRGETDMYFEDSYNFIKGLDITQLHVFSYSERPGTKALEIPYIVAPETKHERSQRLLALSEEKTHAFYSKYIGCVRKVLLEHAPAGRPMHGFTDNYIRVEVPNRQELDNVMVEVKLGQFNADNTSLISEVIGK